MTTHGTQMDRKWTGCGLDVSICPSVRLSIPNTSLISLTNLMRGIYKRRALALCDFLDGICTEFWVFLDFAYAFLTEVDFRNSYFLFVVFHSRAHKNSKVYIQPAVSFVLKLSLRGNHKPHGTVFDPLHPFI